ncbi:MAG: PQQ-binding-like beta-propeller repeat protein, partial [Polyangia bacterium]|nr:PQQ-binding-like beta-propeller repeat protein [Polyangia bacterium]
MPRRLSVGNSLLLHVRLGVGRLPGVCAMVLLAALAGCKGERLGSKDKEPRQKARPAAKGPAASNPEVLTPKVAWRTPFTGRVEPLVLLGEVLIVSSRQRGDRAAGRRLAGFSTTDGRMLWQRPLRLRYFDPGATFSTSHAAVGGVLAVALSAGRVEGLDPRTGAKLWQLRADGGVVAAGDYFAISRSDEVLLVGPKDGKTVKLQRLDEIASGAPGNGLMDAMPKGARLGAAPGVIHFPRRHGGALQVMDAVTLAGRWLLGPDGALADRPARLAATRSTLLLPRLFPKAQVNTQIRVLRTDPREISGAGATSRWEVTVPGRVTAKRLFVTADKVIALSRSSNRQTLLVRVDRAKGTLLDARPFPTPHFCFLGEGLLACQREKEIRALDLETLATRWRYEPGPSTTIHQVRRAGGSLVIEVGSQLLVKRLADGRVTLDQPRLLERHPYRVVAALGEADGRLVMAVRHLEGSPWGDRLVLLGLDLGTGKPAYAHRIWRFPRPEAARPGAVQEDEKLPGQLPMLWIGPGRGGAAKVLTLFEKTMQLVEAASGRALLARGLPGEEGKPVRLLGEEGGVALWQRGTTLFAIALPEAKLLWQASLFRARQI